MRVFGPFLWLLCRVGREPSGLPTVRHVCTQLRGCWARACVGSAFRFPSFLVQDVLVAPHMCEVRLQSGVSVTISCSAPEHRA